MDGPLEIFGKHISMRFCNPLVILRNFNYAWPRFSPLSPWLRRHVEGGALNALLSDFALIPHNFGINFPWFDGDLTQGFRFTPNMARLLRNPIRQCYWPMQELHWAYAFSISGSLTGTEILLTISALLRPERKIKEDGTWLISKTRKILGIKLWRKQLIMISSTGCVRSTVCVSLPWSMKIISVMLITFCFMILLKLNFSEFALFSKCWASFKLVRNETS